MTDPIPKEQQEGEKVMSFLEHLEELRSRLLYSIAAIVLCSIGAGIFHKEIFLSLTRSVPDLYWHTPLEPYFTFLKLSIVVGVFIAFPYVLYELWRFVSPGLYQKERKYLMPFIGASWILFVTGAMFVYFIMLPFISNYLYGSGLIDDPKAPRPLEQRWETLAQALLLNQTAPQDATHSMELEQTLAQIQQDLDIAKSEKPARTQVGNIWSVGRYVNLALVLFLAFGVAFDLPVVVVLLTSLGIVKPKTLGKARPVILVLIFLVSAILTPPDVLSQIMMGVPMYLLFEISLWISSLILYLKKTPQ